jgi:hypothetical protein
MYDKEVEDGLVILHKDDVWKDAELMLADIKNHPYKVVQNDQPAKLLIGYKSTCDDSVWNINIVNLRNFKFKEVFQTGHSKEILLNTLNEGK